MNPIFWSRVSSSILPFHMLFNNIIFLSKNARIIEMLWSGLDDGTNQCYRCCAGLIFLSLFDDILNFLTATVSYYCRREYVCRFLFNPL